MIKRWLDECVVLLEDAVDITSAVGDVTPQAPRQANVGVGVDKHLHIQQLLRSTQHDVTHSKITERETIANQHDNSQLDWR